MAGDISTTQQFVLFWGGWPSQWFKCRFTIDGVEYNCCEQYMMAQKALVFGDVVTRDRILKARSPRDQKALGREVSGFDAGRWNRVCRGIVYRGNLAKFTQDAELGRLLLETGSRTIVEASPTDRIWGIGLAQDDLRAQDPAQWLGTNWLGIALMHVRQTMQEQALGREPVLDEELRRQLEALGARSQ